jgi:hypothetical protein
MNNLAMASTLNQSPYTLKDLEILENERNYNEFFLHAYDLRPSERGRVWKKMYQNMAITMVEDKIKSLDFSKETFQEIEKKSQQSPLNSDELFQFKRNQYALMFFKECYFDGKNKSEMCDKELLNYWDNSLKDPDLALKFVNWLEINKRPINTWPFYSTIINDQVAPIYCKKADVQKAIIKKINLDTFNENFNGNFNELVSKLVPEKCLKELYPTLKEILTSPQSDGLEKEMALSILDSKSKLSTDELDFFLTLYLFAGPVVGEKMNLAWKSVEKLAENYTKRQSILEKMKNLEMLPDKIFIDPKLPRNKAIIAHFAKNFPEMLNYYGSSCLNYINGLDNQKVGSKTNCNSFLSTAKEIYNTDKVQWTSDSIRVQYSSLKK